MASLFVRKVKDKKTGNIKVQICSNTREGKKVKQKCKTKTALMIVSTYGIIECVKILAPYEIGL